VSGHCQSSEIPNRKHNVSSSEVSSFHSSEDGTDPVPKHCFFSSYLEFRAIDKAHKPSNSERYTPSSQPFRKYKIVVIKKKIKLPTIILNAVTFNVNFFPYMASNLYFYKLLRSFT
jgi:hypothetical protein